MELGWLTPPFLLSPAGIMPCRLHTSRMDPLGACTLSSTPTSVPTRIVCVPFATNPRLVAVMQVVPALLSSLTFDCSLSEEGDQPMSLLSTPACGMDRTRGGWSSKRWESGECGEVHV